MKPFTASELPALVNEWMRRFTVEPEKFAAQFQTVSLFLAEQQGGKTPSYGDTCVQYLGSIRRDLIAANIAPAPLPEIAPSLLTGEAAARIVSAKGKPRAKAKKKSSAKKR